MEDYLINDLHVPNDRIQCLVSPHPNSPLNINASDIRVPSRAEIVSTLLGLINKTEIQFGDNIVIYFSGHGSSYECHGQEHQGDPHHVCQCAIEAICPSDRNTTDGNGAIITDITDRELNAILTQICRAKGQKITVILDCCFSASLTRAPMLVMAGVRSIPQLQQRALDDALRIAHATLGSLPGYKSVSDREWCPDMDSHVVLAACSEHEFAKEERGPGGDTNGVFTIALLRALRSDLRDDVTYESLLSLLTASPTQTPVVAGTHRADRLWYRE
ncbi:hypothetical protein EV421DRAFT_1825540 [Armillaria borealis]|uniref:Peptidase C14 caspase domain-containing protein n=1 Tax=Armillaria borealis TaxID=47425 RepID=A0AA39J908_9AGAR|nr:hypothetical protein EV421DRAFT_1825540 [Armillaria borealis]